MFRNSRIALLGGLLALTGMAVSFDRAPATMPRESTRRLAPVPSRKAKKRRSRAMISMRGVGRRGNKLGRRLRRKFELGMSGSF